MALENRQRRYQFYLNGGDTVKAKALKEKYPDVEVKKEVKEEVKIEIKKAKK